MPIPSSGPISFSQIRSEMNSDNSGAISMSALYSNGSLGARGVTGVPASGTLSFSHFTGKRGNPVPSGLVAKYSGDSWNGSTLVDETGSGNNSTATRGTISTTTEANTPLKMIYGGTTAGIQMPSGILPSTYTCFSIIRYNGATRRRILEGIEPTNWLSGHWNGQTCVAYHEGWVTSSSSPNAVGTAWVLSTDQNTLYRGNKTTYGSSGGSSNARLSIHYGAGSYNGSETSDWAVYAILVYNRALSATEYNAVENYLAGLYHIQIMTKYNWYSLFTRTNGGFTIEQAGSDPDVQLRLSSSSIGSSNNVLYYNNRLQDYSQLTIDFEIYVTNAVADGASFNMGCTSASLYGEGPNAPGFCTTFHTYTGPGGRAAGIYLFNDAGTQVGYYSVSLGNGTWTPVRIIYNRSATSTWQITYNNVTAISYSNPNNETWVTSTSGSYCGFASRTGGATMDFYVRRFTITT